MIDLRILAVLLLTLPSCVPRTSAVVEIDADPGVRDATRSVIVWVRGGESRAPRLHRQIEREDLEWPLYVVLVPDDDGVADDEFRVSVRVFDGVSGTGDLVSSRYLRGDYLTGVDGLYQLVLDEECGGIECNEPLDETCYFGRCVPGDHGQPTDAWRAME